MGRRARIVVAGDAGDPPIVHVDGPWWPEARTLVAAAEDAVGAPLRLLRRLSVESGENGRDSELTYLFEREGGPPASEPDHPLRSPWARSGWIDAVLEWEPVASRIAGRPVQEKWWNLSAVLEIPTRDGPAWLKAIPSFFADEGRVIELLSEFRVPTLLGVGERMILMEAIAGEDQWDADELVVEELLSQLVEIQTWSVDRLDDFLAVGAHDRRAPQLVHDFCALVDRHDVRSTLTTQELADLDEVAPYVEAWAQELDGCGLPTTLLHGDFHPGNARGATGGLVILDWTDTAIGSPLTDLPTLVVRLTDDRVARAQDAVARLWSQHVNGIDFDRAFALAEVLRAAMDALTYREFLDGIEPSEQIDHEADVPAALRRLLDRARRLRP